MPPARTWQFFVASCNEIAKYFYTDAHLYNRPTRSKIVLLWWKVSFCSLLNGRNGEHELKLISYINIAYREWSQNVTFTNAQTVAVQLSNLFPSYCLESIGRLPHAAWLTHTHVNTLWPLTPRLHGHARILINTSCS